MFKNRLRNLLKQIIVCIKRPNIFPVISLATKPRSVNLALETTFEFSNKQDVSIIEKVRKFLNKIENAVDAKLEKRNGMTGTNEFTDFLQNLISVINSYDDDDFQQVFSVLDDVVHNFKYESKFNELFENDKLKFILSDVLRKIKMAPVQFLRGQLQRNLRGMKKKMPDDDFLNFLNRIYKRTPTKALKQTLNNFKSYGKKSRTSDSNDNLKDIIQTAVKSLIYDQYSNLNDDTKRDVKTWLNALTKNSDYDDAMPNKETPRKQIKKKQEINSPRYSFVTLYPEVITLAMTYNKPVKMKSIDKTSEEKNDNNYIVKSFSPVLPKIKDGLLMNESTSSSSSSLEYEWRTQRKRVTSLRQSRLRPGLRIPNTRNKPYKIHYNVFKGPQKTPHMLRRTELDEKDSNKTINDKCPKETASANYIKKIKKLEEELQRVKEELKTKIATLKKNGEEKSSNIKDNSEIYFRVSDLSSPVTIKRDNTRKPSSKYETTPEYFNTNANITNKNATKRSEEFVSHETRELVVDNPYNYTNIKTDQSNHTNQTSLVFTRETTAKIKNTTETSVQPNQTQLNNATENDDKMSTPNTTDKNITTPLVGDIAVRRYRKIK